LDTAPFEPWNDPTEQPIIRFKGVQKKFGDFTAIHDLSLDIYAREFFALLGPSGCGKTTMMRMLAGFETPTTGSIELAGQDIVGVPPNKRSVNMMFQSYALFPHLSIWENIAFGLKRSKLPKGRFGPVLGKGPETSIAGRAFGGFGQEAASGYPVRIDGYSGEDRHDFCDRHP